MIPQAMLPPSMQRLQRWALLVGMVAAGLCILGAVGQPRQFFRSYLMAYLFWLGVVLGCLAVLMLHHIMGGMWGMVTRRVLEAATRLLPLMLLLSLPLVFGLPDLYPWAHQQSSESHGAGQFRQFYLSVPFFLWRAAFYFLGWLLLALFLNRWSRQQEQGQEASVSRRLRRRLGSLSAGGLALYGLTVTFASIDWMMSLEAPWFSSIYGFMIVTGQLLVAMAFAIIVTAWLAHSAPVAAVASPGLFHDLGNLLLAFVMLWAYMAFSQFLIIWFGNLPEEVVWYVHRSQGGWNGVGLLLLMLHFALPFVLLLSRRSKQHRQRLTGVAILVFGMRLVDIYWLVMPAFFPERLHVHWLDGVIPVAMGGLWLAAFCWQLQRRSLLPDHEPGLQEVLQQHG